MRIRFADLKLDFGHGAIEICTTHLS